MTSEELSQYLNEDIELVEQALKTLGAEELVERVELEDEDKEEATEDDYYDPSLWEQK